VKRHTAAMRQFRILTINPGSTSTKVALFQGSEPVISRTLGHTDRELLVSKKVLDQLSIRESAVGAFMDENLVSKVDAVAGRGGLLRPLPGGTYRVSEDMCRDLEQARYGEHASIRSRSLDNAQNRTRSSASMASMVVICSFSLRASACPAVRKRNAALLHSWSTTIPGAPLTGRARCPLASPTLGRNVTVAALDMIAPPRVGPFRGARPVQAGTRSVLACHTLAIMPGGGASCQKTAWTTANV